MICAPRPAGACEFWSGLALLGALSFPAARHPLESSMNLHMLVQFPLLALSGILLAGALSPPWRSRVNAWNAYGIAGLFGAAVIMAVVMIPRVLDLALADTRIEFAKMIALVLCGMALRLSWRPAGLLVQGFFLGNVLPMTAAAGQLYQDSPARLCNAYLLDDQMGLGRMLVGISVTVGLAWLAQLVIAMMRREAAAALPPSSGALIDGEHSRPSRTRRSRLETAYHAGNAPRSRADVCASIPPSVVTHELLSEIKRSHDDPSSAGRRSRCRS